jgi:hypothetical protein
MLVVVLKEAGGHTLRFHGPKFRTARDFEWKKMRRQASGAQYMFQFHSIKVAINVLE